MSDGDRWPVAGDRELSAYNASMSPSATVIRSYRDLRVWRTAIKLVVESYQVSHRLPRSEAHGLASQIQRAAVSIPANIAEGHGRNHLGDYVRHLSIANGSLKELETHIVIIEQLGLLRPEATENARRLASETGRMLSGLVKKLKALR
jgi:four helix bundle protein